jgi:hypothetical protein
LFHAFEDEIDAESLPLLQAAQRGQHVIFFANAFGGPFNGDLVVAGVSLYPALIIVRPLAENFFVHYRNAEHLPDKMHYLFGPRESIEITIDHDAVEAVIYKNEKIAK